jgi:hypothetical protein
MTGYFDFTYRRHVSVLGAIDKTSKEAPAVLRALSNGMQIYDLRLQSVLYAMRMEGDEIAEPLDVDFVCALLAGRGRWERPRLSIRPITMRHQKPYQPPSSVLRPVCDPLQWNRGDKMMR